MGVTNALCLSADPAVLARRFQGFFDAVLVDAPCSGEGMFRRVPESRGEWTLEGVLGCQKRQREILESAAAMLRPGGRFVYSTCTLNHYENADQVAWLCSMHPEFHQEAFHVPGVDADGQYTCYPHRFRGEGQFAALLRKDGGEAVPALPSLPAADRKETALLREFSRFEDPVFRFGETLVSIPECPELKGLKVLRCGLHLGTVRSGRFCPDHAWAVSRIPPRLSEVSLSEEQAMQYLAGEVVREAEGRGWVLSRYQGMVLGLGKVSDGVMKNHYPKGLRKTHLTSEDEAGENV
jgi:tRNA and rRNA cytosine-C5-methylases